MKQHYDKINSKNIFIFTFLLGILLCLVFNIRTFTNKTNIAFAQEADLSYVSNALEENLINDDL